MQNYKKLLFAGLAIVPLALSSWTSNDQNASFENGNGTNYSSIERLGDTAASSTVTVKTEKTVFSVSSVKESEKVSTKVAVSLEPILTFDKVINSYK